MTDYSAVPSLAHVYLEDSYVREIVERPGELRFRLEAVLTESHPAYRPPNPGEQYRYALGWLVIPATRVVWADRTDRRYTDASGDVDLGNIDFLVREPDHWRLGGDWGVVRTYPATEPRLDLDAAVS
jgi:hypothetical protein